MSQLFDPHLHPEWLPLHADFALHVTEAAALAQKLPAESGVYLWTMRHNDVEHTLYVGKATLLSRRIYNYSQSFQPHSPNDRKLYFAQAAIRETKPNACFPLYWKQVPTEKLNTVELAAISEFKPVLNDRNTYSFGHRERLAAAYGELYREVIAKHFGEA